MLHATARLVAETQEIGVNVIGGLHEQRLALIRSNEKVRLWLSCVSALHSGTK